ncbi:MAG: cell division protein ZapA [Candidatus Hydrogenedentes bacterium]|nr:cell division protein ZapA [Candidatus Hydrogenedentota bacterium]
MTRPTVEVRIAGLTLRVAPCGTHEQTAAIVEAVNARLKQFEAASTKVNTQAFALQAAYEFAKELAELQDRIAAEEQTVRDAVNGLVQRIEAIRREIEDSTETPG